MIAKCPHCGTEFDAEDSEYGRFVKCAICGKGFIAGVLSSKRRVEASWARRMKIPPNDQGAERVWREKETLVQSNKKARFRKLIASVPWIARSSTVCLFVSAVVLALVAGIVLYVGYDSARERMEELRDDDYTDDDDSLPSYGGSHSSGYESPKRADVAIAGALANVRSRYRANLQRYGLTESYYDETGGICDLMLLDVNSWTKYQIVFYRSSGQLEWPRTMPKGVAELLMHDRMLIDTYEKTSGR